MSIVIPPSVRQYEKDTAGFSVDGRISYVSEKITDLEKKIEDVMGQWNTDPGVRALVDDLRDSLTAYRQIGRTLLRNNTDQYTQDIALKLAGQTGSYQLALADLFQNVRETMDRTMPVFTSLIAENTMDIQKYVKILESSSSPHDRLGSAIVTAANMPGTSENNVFRIYETKDVADLMQYSQTNMGYMKVEDGKSYVQRRGSSYWSLMDGTIDGSKWQELDKKIYDQLTPGKVYSWYQDEDGGYPELQSRFVYQANLAPDHKDVPLMSFSTSDIPQGISQKINSVFGSIPGYMSIIYQPRVDVAKGTDTIKNETVYMDYTKNDNGSISVSLRKGTKSEKIDFSDKSNPFFGKMQQIIDAVKASEGNVPPRVPGIVYPPNYNPEKTRTFEVILHNKQDFREKLSEDRGKLMSVIRGLVERVTTDQKGNQQAMQSLMRSRDEAGEFAKIVLEQVTRMLKTTERKIG